MASNLNGKEYPDMGGKRRPASGNARFIELGSPGAPFRSLVNIDHITNVRFEQHIINADPEYDDQGNMTSPGGQMPAGWKVVIVLGHGAGGQNIAFPDEHQAAACYNEILDMIQGVGGPIARKPKLEFEQLPEPSSMLGPDGKPLDLGVPGNDDLEDPLPGEVPELTDEELDQLENPEIDVDGIADAVEEGLGKDQKN